MAIEPITTDAEYERALARVEELWGARPGTAEGAQLDALATLIEAYERKRWTIDPADPIAVIEFQLDQQQLGPDGLARIVGGRKRAEDILARRRPLTLPMIRRLAADLRIPAEILIQPYTLDQSAA